MVSSKQLVERMDALREKFFELEGHIAAGTATEDMAHEVHAATLAVISPGELKGAEKSAAIQELLDRPGKWVRA